MTHPALALLVQAYLTLDWPDDYPNAWAAIDDFLAREPSADELANEVTKLLDSASTDEALERYVLDNLGSGYSPEADGLTMREWLEALRQYVHDRNPRS